MVKAGGPGRGEHLLGELRPGQRTLPGPWGTKTFLGKFLGLFTLPSSVAGFPGLVWMVLLSLCLGFSHLPGCLQSPPLLSTQTGQVQSWHRAGRQYLPGGCRRTPSRGGRVTSFLGLGLLMSTAPENSESRGSLAEVGQE